MVKCAVLNCKNRSDKKEEPFQFFMIPHINSRVDEALVSLVLERRARWIERISREDLTLSSVARIANARVCSRHFVSGRPAPLKDTENPDWAPSLNLGYDSDEDEDKSKKKKRFSIDVQNEETSGSSKGDIKLDVDNFEISFEDFFQNIDPKEKNLDHPKLETAQDSGGATVSEDELDCDPLTYYVYGLKFSNPSCDVTHESAFQSAKTLLMYMESQNDADLADIVTIRRYMRKIKDKIKVTEM